SFFFQAEDGIRDKLVTGVQTCALPIFSSKAIRARALQACPSLPRTTTAGRRSLPSPRDKADMSRSRVRRFISRRAVRCRTRAARSEERRVGKGERLRLEVYLVK